MQLDADLALIHLVTGPNTLRCLWITDCRALQSRILAQLRSRQRFSHQNTQANLEGDTGKEKAKSLRTSLPREKLLQICPSSVLFSKRPSAIDCSESSQIAVLCCTKPSWQARAGGNERMPSSAGLKQSSSTLQYTSGMGCVKPAVWWGGMTLLSRFGSIGKTSSPAAGLPSEASLLLQCRGQTGTSQRVGISILETSTSR